MTKDEIRSEVEKIITVTSPDDLGGDLCTMYFALTEDQINELVDFIWKLLEEVKSESE